MLASRVCAVDGPLVDLLFAHDAPSLHAVVTIATAAGDRLLAEVTALPGDGRVRALALGPTEGVAVGDAVASIAGPLRVPVGPASRGRVIDPLGRPLDGGEAASGASAPLHTACTPLAAARAPEVRETGIRAIDLLAPLPAWGVVGVAGAAGAGKTRLLYELVSNSGPWREAYGVLAYVGVRPGEVDDMREELRCSFLNTGESVLAQATLVAATMGEPAGLRARAVHAAVAVATHIRDVEKRDVFLVIDDACRALEAAAEVAVYGGAVPGRGLDAEGLWAAVDARRRGGQADGGRLLSIESIALPAGGLSDPLVSVLVRHLDALIVLTSAPASCLGTPMVDPRRTTSPMLDASVVGERHLRLATGARSLLLRLDAFERLGAAAQPHALRSPDGALIARARRLRLYLVQPLFVFDGITNRPGCWSSLDSTLRDVEAIVGGDVDGVPEACFVLARDLDEVRARAGRGAR